MCWRLISSKIDGGGERDRTDDLLLAKQALSQLSYTPSSNMVGLVGLEPTTPALSRRCSNQLSYRPFTFGCEASGCGTVQPGAKARSCSVLSRLTFTRCVSTTADKGGRKKLSAIFQKGGDPAAPSDTATLLRLHPSHEPCRGNRPPCG